jgi:large subunit ribosomal protein LP1
MSNAELAVSYAALILADESIEITADKLNTLIKAAGVADVEPIWASLFAKALEGKDLKEMLLNVGSGGAAPAAAAGAASSGAAAGGAAEAVEEKKEGTLSIPGTTASGIFTDQLSREGGGGVRRGHGIRSLRLNGLSHINQNLCVLWEGCQAISGLENGVHVHFGCWIISKMQASGAPNFQPLNQFVNFAM